MANDLPAQAILRELLRYEPDTGKLYWRERPREMFPATRTWNAWNARFAGKEAMTAPANGGHRRGTIFGKQYLAHRVIWKMVTGEEPDEIDHEDGEGGNNRWGNLKDGSHGDNMKNTRRRADNTSGVTGVCWNEQRQKWQAAIRVNGRSTCLGLFPMIDDAITARRAAERKYGFHENHGRVQ